MSVIDLKEVVYDTAQKRVLNGINLKVEAGEIVSIMGQSGSGKTTMLKLLTGLRRPTSGQVLINGQDIATMSERELDEMRLKMGLVFQYAALFDSLNVFDNIVFGLVRHKKELTHKDLEKLVAGLLESVGLEGTEKLLPSELSGGMQKRVGLARALAMDPEILFYDEPTSGLDPITSAAIDKLIVQTRDRHNVTSVVVSHHLPSVFGISDRIAMLSDGHIVAYGTPGELRADVNPVVQEFIGADIALTKAKG